MIAKSYIAENLRHLDAAYNNPKIAKHGLYFSKLAVLELCGWIETSMDDIVSRHARRWLSEPANLTLVEKDIVKKTYGFDYDGHFRKMVIRLIGLIECESVEAALDATTIIRLKSHLSSLKVARDRLAHTYVKGPLGTTTIDAPSVTRARLDEIYDGLKAYDDALRSL